MASDFKIGVGLALDGEADFKKAVSGINKDLSVLGSEMKKVTAQFSDNADSMESLTAKQEVYNKRADEQKKKIDIITSALESAKKEYGENSDKVKDWQIKLNNAETELSKTESALKQTGDQINNFGKEADDAGGEVEKAGKQAKESGDNAEKGGSGWSKLGDGLKTIGGLAAKAVAAVATAAVGVGTAIVKVTADSAAWADEVNTLSKQTGLSTEEIQKYQFASEQIDVSFDTLSGSMAKLTKNMGNARDGSKDTQEAFKKLGVSITDDVTGELRDNEDVFNDAINALGKISNETERDEIAMKLFGKSAQDLNPLILGGTDALKTLGDQAEKAGLILGQDALDQLNSFTDSLDTAKATVQAAGRIFSVVFADDFAKIVDKFTEYVGRITGAFNEDGFSGAADEVKEIIGEIVDDIKDAIAEYAPKVIELATNVLTEAVDFLSEILPSLLPPLVDGAFQLLDGIMDAIIENLDPLIDAATAIIIKLADFMIEALPQIQDALIQIVVKLAEGITKALPKLIPAAVDAVITLAEGLIDNIDLLIDAAIDLALGIAEGIVEAIPDIVEKIPEVIESLIDAIVDNLPKILEAGMKITIEVAVGLVKAIPDLVAKLPELIQAIVTGLVDLAPKLWDAGKNIVADLLKGLKEAWTDIVNWLSDAWDDLLGDKTLNVDTNSGLTVGGIGNSYSPKRYKTGVSFVQSDWTPAYLDYGERVLTKEQNAAYTSTKTSSSDALLREQNRLLKAILDKDPSVNIDGKEVFTAVRKQNQAYYRQTGKSALA
jgi:phage-related protein